MTPELSTILAATIAAMMIIYQLGRQHRNELAREENATRSKLKLEIYQEFSPFLSNSLEAFVETGGYARSSPLHAAMFATQISIGWSPMPIPDRAKVFQDLHFKAVNSMTDLIIQLEKYFIVCPRLEIFRLAFGCALHDLGSRFDKLHTFMIQHYPVDVGDTGAVNFVKAFDSQLLQEQQSLCLAYANAEMDINTYLSDLRNELQTLLLGELFPGNRLPKRIPIDPAFKVISLEPEAIGQLQEYFLNQTEWGKQSKKYEMDAHIRFQNSTGK